MIARLRQVSESRLKQLAGLEISQTAVERNIIVQWARKDSVADENRYRLRALSGS